MADGNAHLLKKPRALRADVERPVFKLGGLAIGNGFTGAWQLLAIVGWLFKAHYTPYFSGIVWFCC
jgi:hypothetical protein